jgi:hypothetical protein
MGPPEKTERLAAWQNSKFALIMLLNTQAAAV